MVGTNHPPKHLKVITDFRELNGYYGILYAESMFLVQPQTVVLQVNWKNFPYLRDLTMTQRKSHSEPKEQADTLYI